MHNHKWFSAMLLIVALFSAAGAKPIPQDKLKPEDVLAKHLAALGSADSLAATKSIVASGDAKAVSHSSAIKDVIGVSQIASEGDKVVLAMLFNSTSYPYDKVGYDGQKTTVSIPETTGQRTALGDFLMSQQVIVKEGLIGGVLSSAWPLLNVTEKGSKLSYAGTKKINDRLVHELKYTPRKGAGDLKISLFFDAETFQHVRTEYSYTTSARMGARPSSGPIATATGATSAAGTDTGSSTINRYKLVEEFSDFKSTEKRTLPQTYKLRLTVDAQGSRLLEWVMNFTKFTFNQPLDAAAFNVSKTK